MMEPQPSTDPPAAADTGDEARVVIQPPREGDRLGRFVLAHALGHGAMATVFRARDSSLGREVAIKVLNPAIASQNSSAERFRREAMAVAALRHPNIVEVYDFVPASGGQSAYLVQELIGGQTLQALLDARGGRMIPEVAAVLVADLADALSAAHQKGVVHRDVKPANIMLERQDAGARVVLTDFGVAHIGELTTMTATGAMVGSPAYMAPEQARGLSVGPQVDVWALGVLLYQMSTGKLPFPGRDPITVITSICKGDYKRAAQIDARVGTELDRIIVGCLKPQPAERFASAAEVARLLRAAAHKVGLIDSKVVLRRLMDEPAVLEEELKPTLAQDAVATARQLMRKRQLARALAELGRATAYVPKHAEALKLLDALTAQRRWGQVVGVAAAVFVTVAIAGGSYRVWRRSAEPQAAPPAVPAATNTPAETAATVPTVNAPAEPAAVAQPQPVQAAAVTPVLTSAKKPSRRTAHAKSAPQTVAGLAPVAPAEPPPPEPTVEAAPPPEPAPAPQATSSVRLFTRFAFCFPSLDEDTARKAPPRSYTVSAGAHEVYCALTRDGPRVHAGTLQVRPGTRLDVNIVPDAQGQPKLSAGR